MRLRLTVKRNALPPTNTLWSVSDTNSAQAYTVARLLEDINHVIPLEAEHWGLEHYVVEVGGFECLHFSPVADMLREDDHVTIRPLLKAEVRARTLAGREQITEDGRHLVDGVPFGRPYLRQPSRPAIRIPAPEQPDSVEMPPSKRQRVQGSLPSYNGPESGLPGGADSSTNGNSAEVQNGERKSTKGSKAVRFEQRDFNIDDSDSEEDDEDFLPDNAESDMDLDGGLEDDSDSGVDEVSAKSSSSETSDSDSDSSDASSSSDSDSDDDSDAESVSAPEVQSSKVDSENGARKEPVAPGQGSLATKRRNARKSMSRRLRLLKRAGKLHERATLRDLEEYELNEADEENDQTNEHFPVYSGKRKLFFDDEEDEASHVSVCENPTGSMATNFADLPSQIANIGTASREDVEGGTEAVKENPRKRLRPDTSAIARMLAHQIKPAKKSMKTKKEEESAPEPEGVSDPDFYKSRINVSAFECWDEAFELSAPPFPFKQHWDPASKLMREKVENKKQKKRKMIDRESLKNEGEEEETIVLDYDDAPALKNTDAEIQNAIEDQLRQDVATAAQQDLPPLPDDIGALSELAASEVKEGAIIVCKFLDMNPTTMTPEISDFKTAIVDREGDSGSGAGTIRLKIAQRDLLKREKRFDKQGNRIYDAADQFYMDDGDEDDGLWEGHFSELLEPKLLRAA